VRSVQARFEAREPRVEDVQRIAQLEDLCAQKDDKYDKLYDATKKMRLELLNREENYNKVFGAAPVVQQVGFSRLSIGIVYVRVIIVQRTWRHITTPSVARRRAGCATGRVSWPIH
jgi:hypothetical protein